MMLALSLLLAPLAIGQDSHDPGLAPTRAKHALLHLPGAEGAVAAIGDADGDGLSDLVASFRSRLVVVSSTGGDEIQALGPADTWAVGPDLDGDGLRDLVVGNLSERLVTLLSSRKGKVLLKIEEPLLAEFGGAVAWIDDLDEDGVPDFVIGSPGARAVEARSSSSGRLLWRSTLGARKDWGAWIRVVGDLDGDGQKDLAVGAGPFDRYVNELVSGRTGLAAVPNWTAQGPATGVGDLDGDGVPDLFIDKIFDDSRCRNSQGHFVSVGRRRLLAKQGYPDALSEYGTTTNLGDMDGDGVADLGLGDPNFHLRGPGDPRFSGTPVDLDALTLAQAVNLSSAPWCAFTWESGCAWVLSGRTREVIAAVYGEPGSRDGMGLWMSPLPDVSGDGHPDFAVAAADGVYIFAGPGAR